MDQLRKPFQGVLNILSFNRHYYIYGLAVLGVLCLSRFLIEWPAVLFWGIVAAFLYGLIMPLIVSAYVYDLSGFYQFKWLNKVVRNNEEIKRVVNVNAGFDETSFILKSKFPGADLQVFDFYNSHQHTEVAIKRARNASAVYPGTQQIASDAIPLKDSSADFIFLLSAAHKIRAHSEKIRFLKECFRVCKPTGRVIMVEHLRDFPNFLAFTIGFTHFFSRGTWKDAFERAGSAYFHETKFTPFMSVITCSPAHNPN